MEVVPELSETAQQLLNRLGYKSIKTHIGNGYEGWLDHVPFDAIIVTCAAGHLPPPLWEQLAPGGRIVIPIGGPYQTQRLVVITKEPDGSRRSKTVLAVRFVPMTGEAQR